MTSWFVDLINGINAVVRMSVGDIVYFVCQIKLPTVDLNNIDNTMVSQLYNIDLND